jgi:hypothetical protein
MCATLDLGICLGNLTLRPAPQVNNKSFHRVYYPSTVPNSIPVLHRRHDAHSTVCYLIFVLSLIASVVAYHQGVFRVLFISVFSVYCCIK